MIGTRRVPVRTQVSQTECGLACALAVLEHFGRFLILREARELVRPGRNGLSVKEIGQIFEANGCEVHCYRAGADRLGELQFPAIVFWRDYHFIVLERLSAAWVHVMDPDLGRRRMSRAEFDDSYSQIVLTATPTPEFEPRRRPWLHEWRLPGLRWDLSAKDLVAIAAITIVTYLLTLSLPIVTSRLIDTATGTWGASPMSWRTAVIALGAGAGLYVAAEALRALFTSRVVRRLGASLMLSTFSRLLRLPLEFFSTRIPGELMHRLGTVNYVRDALSNRIVQSVFDVGMTLVVLGYIWMISGILGAVASALLLLMFGFLLATRRPLSQAIDEEITALTLAQGVQYDAVSSIAQLKMGGYSDDMEGRWRIEYDRSLKSLHHRMMWQIGAVGSVSGAFQIFGPLALLVMGLQLRGMVSLGQIVAVSSLASVMFAGTSGLLAAFTDLLTCSRYLRRLEDIMGTDPEPCGGTHTDLAHSAISLRGVTFHYANEAVPVLHDVDLDIADGELAAVVGQSGSGKSTLAKILCGLYEPSTGQVFIGGRPLADYDRTALRRQIGYVPQDVTLHNGTILENLAMGTELGDDVIEQCCRQLGFLEFVEELPMGYRTLVSDLGANFSGGQRQRLAIARVLLRSPRIVIFDEATSALDRINERRVNRVLQRLGCTRIVIAHRLETIQFADTIHVAADGTFVERGTHDHLLNSEGAYAALYREGVPA